MAVFTSGFICTDNIRIRWATHWKICLAIGLSRPPRLGAWVRVVAIGSLSVLAANYQDYHNSYQKKCYNSTGKDSQKGGEFDRHGTLCKENKCNPSVEPDTMRYDFHFLTYQLEAGPPSL